MDNVSAEHLRKSVQAQASVRLKLGLPVAFIAILVDMYWKDKGAGTSSGIGFISAYIIYTLSAFALSRRPGHFSWRDLAIGTAILDPIILSAWLYAEGESAILVIGFYLFTILGFGFRIGPQLMRVCQGVSIIGFAWVLIASPFWREHPFFGLSHLVLLFVVPMYAGNLMRDLREAKARAEYESKAKTQLLANVSHELKTPLTGIVAAAQLLESRLEDPSDTKLVQSIINLSGSLDLEINQLLDLAKIGVQPAAGPPMPFDVRVVTGQVEAALEEIAHGKGVDLQVEVDERIVYPVIGQPQSLRSILMNLAGNAVKFTHKGHVRLQVKLMHADDRAYRLWFGVEDTGIGISQDHQSRLFDPFYQVETGDRRKYRGTGLGTSIAREHVLRMGSDIQVQSILGEGSLFSFEVEMPFTGVAAAEEGEANPAAIVSPKRILIADDNALNLELLQQSLAKDGHEVISAQNGQSAIERFSELDFDVVMLDFNMGDIDGLTVFQTMNFGRIHVPPTFFVTADTTSETAARLNQAGAAGVIYKPLTFQKLRGALSTIFPDESNRPALPASAKLEAVPTEYVDRNVLEVLKEIKDQPTFIYKIIGDGIADLKDLQNVLGRSIREKDIQAVHHHAHAMRGVSVNVGAVRLGARCERLMALTSSGLAGNAEQLASDLAATTKRTLDDLEELRAPFASSSRTA